MLAFAELEANLLSERAKKGLDAARGKFGGRPKTPYNMEKFLLPLYDNESYTINEIIKKTNNADQKNFCRKNEIRCYRGLVIILLGYKKMCDFDRKISNREITLITEEKKQETFKK